MLLLVSANRVVSAERLVDDLWGGRPPEGAQLGLTTIEREAAELQVDR